MAVRGKNMNWRICARRGAVGLYFVILLLLGVTRANAGSESVLYTFKWRPDGGTPVGALLPLPGGGFYGTTVWGGNVASCHRIFGCGTVFRLDPPAAGGKWTHTIVYSFGPSAANPISGVIVDGSGALYGTTEGGGIGGCPGDDSVQPGCGTVYRIANKHLDILHRFRGAPDGAVPIGGLTMDAQGNIYGTTLFGGLRGCSVGCWGTVFRLSPPAAGGAVWTETILYRFKNQGDGSNPRAALLLDKSGTLYGRNENVVFTLTPPKSGSAWTFQTIYADALSRSGSHQPDLLMVGGVLYGAASNAGGTNNGTGGDVFMLTPPAAGKKAWNATVLYGFGGADSPIPGTVIQSGVVMDGTGALYGAVRDAIYKLTPPAAGQKTWTPSLVYQFPSDRSLGDAVSAELILDGSFGLVGTTIGGGDDDNGVAFAVKP